jgi:hypothetical protein
VLVEMEQYSSLAAQTLKPLKPEIPAVPGLSLPAWKNRMAEPRAAAGQGS